MSEHLVDDPVKLVVAPRLPRRRRDFIYYALHNKKLLFDLSLETLFVLGAIIAPMISPHGFTAFYAAYAKPSAQHWLGTDNLGHDLFAELAWGLRTSYLVGALGAVCASMVGMALMMNGANIYGALQLHKWWWFVARGVVLTGMVAALLIANVGLDEVFNPKLREQ